MTQVGPSIKTTHHCHGCTYLHTEDWEFHEEDDGIDRGTDATCTKLDKVIGSYYQKWDLTPKWCPFKGDKE